jgi:hypothetical protein
LRFDCRILRLHGSLEIIHSLLPLFDKR